MAAVASPKSKKDKIVSCAECRRLKLKCDRNFPCSSCRKRGLSALCPNVALPTRIRKQPSEDVKSNVSEMGSRIQELEDALRSLHARHSQEPHPLLIDRSTSHAPLAEPSGSRPNRPESPAEGNIDRLDESLGTLAIDPQSGKSSFFGQSAGMESLYHNELREEPELSEAQPGWSSEPFDPLRDHIAYPLYPRLPNEVIMQYLEAYLPDPLRAWALCDLYYNHVAWVYSPITRQQFQDEILVPVYNSSPPSLTETSLTHFEVSILFMVFAMGSLLDISGATGSGNYNSHPAAAPLTSSDSDQYHQLARTALTAGVSVIEEPGITGIRSLFLMAFYHMCLDRKQTPQTVWSLTSIAVGLAISIGLHRDSERWKLDPAVVEQRRLTFGRPPQITMPFVDCEVAADAEQSIGSDGKVKHGYRYRIHMITSTILSDVIEVVLNTKQKYKNILMVDRKLRDCAIELFGSSVGDRDVGPETLQGDDTGGTMQNFLLLGIKETCVLYLHRKYFVRACSCRPEDLTTSRYYPSFLAAFRSAQCIITILRSLLILEPILPCHFWFLWSHTLASAIMVGSVAMRHPRSVLATEAMSALECVLESLRQCANQTTKVDRPTRALKIVTKLREKAHLAMSHLGYNPTEADVRHQDDELKVLGGHARVVSTRPYLATAHSSPSTDTPPSADVHPSLMEDLTVVRQQDQDAWQSREDAYSTSSGVPSIKSTGIDLFSGVNAPQSYALSGPFGAVENVEGVAAAVGEVSHSHAQPEYLHLSNDGVSFGPSASMAAMDSYGNMFTIASNNSTAQGWNMTDDDLTDISWQGFIADLGVSGGN